MLFYFFQIDGSIYYGKFNRSAGGVGRNISEAISKLGTTPIFISAVGNDSHGDYILDTLPSNCKKYVASIANETTAQCTVVFDSNGECKLLLGQMDVFNKITPQMVINQNSLKSSLFFC